MEESGAWFQKAIDLQPDYALAWAGLADYYGEGVAGDVLDPRTSIVPEEQAAERALALDPNLPQAHQAMGAMFLIDRWDWADADREMLRAISLDPQNGELYYLRACLLQAVNRDAEAIELGKKAMEIDPFSRPYALASLYSMRANSMRRSRKFGCGWKQLPTISISSVWKWIRFDVWATTRRPWTSGPGGIF